MAATISGTALSGVQQALPPVNTWGAVLLGASVCVVGLVWVYFALRKRLSARGKMDSVMAGQMRLAASRGLVEDLDLLSAVPGFQVDADLKGWTALHAAAVQGQAGGAGHGTVRRVCWSAPACTSCLLLQADWPPCSVPGQP